MRILALFVVLGLIKRREQLAGNTEGIEEQDQMLCVFFPLGGISEMKLKKNKLTL